MVRGNVEVDPIGPAAATAADIEGDHIRPESVVGFEEGAAADEGAGVVDQDVETAEEGDADDADDRGQHDRGNDGRTRSPDPAGAECYREETFGPVVSVYTFRTDDEAVELQNFKKDVGFGFRWITPIAPFRFEWAYPVLDGGKLGDMEIIFYIGY